MSQTGANGAPIFCLARCSYDAPMSGGLGLDQSQWRQHIAQPAAGGVRDAPAHCAPHVTAAFERLVIDLGGRVDADSKPVAEPLAVPVRKPELLLPATWALALLTEAVQRDDPRRWNYLDQGR
jgi:hypothetical protein